ncbi:MAG TPA: UMP kinase [Candidatus Hypogeohydataceae bacterium YC41]
MEKVAGPLPTKKGYKRVVVKISGEGFSSENRVIDRDSVKSIALELKLAHDQAVELAVMVGGGNIVRGNELSRLGTNRAQADYMGMIATVINALVLQDALEALGLKACVQSAIEIANMVEPYNRKKCLRYLEEKKIVLLAGGLGNPYFTTDTAAALKAIELGAEVLLKATKVEGVYSEDPMVNPKAKFFSRLTYSQVLNGKLKAMDSTAITLCMENHLPIIVFNLRKEENIRRAVHKEPVGTYIGEAESES